MGKKRDILTEFREYYNNLSEDAQLLIHSILLVKPKGNGAGKSSSPAPRAQRQSSSVRGLPKGGGVNSATKVESADSVVGRSGE